MYASLGKSLNQNGGGEQYPIIETPKSDKSEKTEIEIALYNYKERHTAVNLQKLCFQIEELCRAVYASTRNESERSIYSDMIAKITK